MEAGNQSHVLGNIQMKWLSKNGITNPNRSEGTKDIVKLKFCYKEIWYKVIINETENWFVLCSSQDIILENPSEASNLAMELSNRAPIGFFQIKSKKNDGSSNKHKIVYKSHQRFIKNDDHININRTIDLHLQDHQILFFEPIYIYNNSGSKDLLGSFDTAFNNY